MSAGDWLPAPPDGNTISFIQAPTHLTILWKGPADTVSGLIGAAEEFMLQPRTSQEWLQLLETYHPEMPRHWMTSAADQLQVGHPPEHWVPLVHTAERACLQRLAGSQCPGRCALSQQHWGTLGRHCC